MGGRRGPVRPLLQQVARTQAVDITWQDVQAWHTKASTKAPYAANRALALLSSMYKQAHKLGYAGPDPTKGISRFPERSRDRFLQPDEMPRFFEALDTEPDPTFRDFIHYSNRAKNVVVTTKGENHKSR